MFIVMSNGIFALGMGFCERLRCPYAFTGEECEDGGVDAFVGVAVCDVSVDCASVKFHRCALTEESGDSYGGVGVFAGCGEGAFGSVEFVAW